MEQEVLNRPLKKYKKASLSSYDYYKIASLEFDSYKKNNLTLDGKSKDNLKDYYKRRLIYQLLGLAASEKDSIYYMSKRMHALIGMDYVKRYRDIKIDINDEERKLVKKIRRESYLSEYINKSVSFLENVLTDSLEQGVACLLCTLFVEKAKIHDNIGSIISKAPLPKCLDMCECIEYKILLSEKYIEALNVCVSTLDTFEIKHAKIIEYYPECGAYVEMYLKMFQTKIDSIESILAEDKNKCS